METEKERAEFRDAYIARNDTERRSLRNKWMQDLYEADKLFKTAARKLEIAHEIETKIKRTLKQ